MYNVLNTKTEVVILNTEGKPVEFETFDKAKEAANNFTKQTGVEHAPIG